jgi:hypothetical protein
MDKKKISTGGKLLIAAGLILAAAVVQYILFNVLGFGDNRVLVMRETGNGVSYEMGSGARFYSHGKRAFYFCTKDGMEYLSSDGSSQWKEIFSMTKPDISAAGDMVAVADAKGNRAYVYNSGGEYFSVDLDYPLLFFSINRTGYLAVILKLESGYSARIYNQRNNIQPVAVYEIHDAQMHPVAMSVSEDGKYAAIAMWSLNVGYESHVSFYYVNEEDSWATQSPEGMLAAEIYDGQAVLNVRFMEENRALVFTDSQIDCFRPGAALPGESNPCPEIWSIDLHNEIDMLDFSGGSRFAFVLGDKHLNDSEAAEPGEVYIYNTSGEHTGTFSLGRKATSLSMGAGGDLLVGAGRRFYALNALGEQLWDYTATFDTAGMFFLGDTNTVLLAGGSSAQIMHREREQYETEPPVIIEEDEAFEPPPTEEVLPLPPPPQPNFETEGDL